ncbi:MAG: hypothetical protein A2020_11955 [Lentisphaerae bacterium GWF2_45_14]|nr:MAG: hypothetical protein A2020_11955 [Lentisphaerae bacterium GWF2_45_14]
MQRKKEKDQADSASQTAPAVKGSLTEVRKTCGKKRCRKCASGERHPAWLFMYRLDGKAHSMHVPKSMVPLLEKALEKGRDMERRMVENGIALIRDRKAK